MRRGLSGMVGCMSRERGRGNLAYITVFLFFSPCDSVGPNFEAKSQEREREKERIWERKMTEITIILKEPSLYCTLDSSN